MSEPLGYALGAELIRHEGSVTRVGGEVVRT